LKDAEQRLVDLDQQIYTAFYQLADDKQKTSLETYYQALHHHAETAEKIYELYNQFMDELSPIYGSMPYEEIEGTLAKVYTTETHFKGYMRAALTNEYYTAFAQTEDQELIKTYSESDVKYFDGKHYDNENLELLNKATSAFVETTARVAYQLKNALLNFKLALLNRELHK
jgi:hypothetical protein